MLFLIQFLLKRGSRLEMSSPLERGWARLPCLRQVNRRGRGVFWFFIYIKDIIFCPFTHPFYIVLRNP